MTEISSVNNVVAASIGEINSVPAANASYINDIGLVVGFGNTYSLKQTVSAYGGYVAINNAGKYHFESGGKDQPFSLSAWIKPSTAKNFWMFMKGKIQAGVTAASLEYKFGLYSNGVVFFAIYGNAAGSSYIRQYDGVDRSSTLANGNWHHLVATYSGDPSEEYGLAFHIDGGSAITGGQAIAGSYTDMHDSGLALWLGSERQAEDPIARNSFIGYLDEMSVWEKKLSNAEVGEIYNSGTPTDLTEHSAASDLLSWWRMGDNDGGAGTTVTDVASGGNGTLNGFQSGDGFTSTTAPGS
jgi:hypothetical protein